MATATKTFFLRLNVKFTFQVDELVLETLMVIREDVSYLDVE
jgi:hypothetical protein